MRASFSLMTASLSYDNKNAMAECLLVRSSMMHVIRDPSYINDSNLDFCDTASVGSRDDHADRDPDFVEDRFRVDRKKLEQMLQGTYLVHTRFSVFAQSLLDSIDMTTSEFNNFLAYLNNVFKLKQFCFHYFLFS